MPNTYFYLLNTSKCNCVTINMNMKLQKRGATMKRKFKAVAVGMAAVIVGVPLAGCNLFSDDVGEDTVNLTVVWDGRPGLDYTDLTDNPVGNKIKQDTGISVNLTVASGGEADNLNRIFAAGKNFPDVIMCPYWGGSDANSVVVRAAAKAGYLMNFDSLIEKYECDNLRTAFTQGISEDFIAFEYDREEFGGGHYFLPMGTPYSIEESENFGYTVYCRKDILEDLGVNAGDIHSSDDVKQLAERIAAGKYKDINGNNIITASCWGNGWSYECYLNSFKTRGFTNVIDNGDGTYTWSAMNPDLDEEVAFMNDFVNSGLFDMSAFSHSFSTALQKHITGGVGLTAAIYSHIYLSLGGTLYKTNPEMRYVPLGPIYDATGNAAMPDTVRANGTYGSAVILITKECKNPETVMRYLDYINSEEGKKLVLYGIEGEDWEYGQDEEGNRVPVRTEAYLEAKEEDFYYDYKRGYNGVYALGVSRIHYNELSDLLYTGTAAEYYRQVCEMYPVQNYEGTRVSGYDEEYEDIKTFRNRLAAVDYGTLITAMYTSSDQSAAADKLASYRERLSKGNVLADYMEWFTENANQKKQEGVKLLF